MIHFRTWLFLHLFVARSTARLHILMRPPCVCGKLKYPTWKANGDKGAKYCRLCAPIGATEMYKKDKKDKRVCACHLKKSPTFGNPGCKRTWCKSCPQKPVSAIDLVSKKCVCKQRTACYALVGSKTKMWCGMCKPDDQETYNTFSGTCECGNGQPHKGLAIDGIKRWCGKCPTAPKEAINLSRMRCECDTALASFGSESDLKARWCQKCKKEGAVNVTSPRCECGRAKRYGDWKIMKAEWCYDCRPKDGSAIYIGRLYCITPLCFTRADNTAYRGYCMRCFIFTFPSEPVSHNHRVKERMAIEKINEVMIAYPHLTTMYDKTIGGCSRRRPDVFIDCLTHVIVMEHDEDGHRSVDCEERRVMVNLSITFFLPETHYDIGNIRGRWQ